MEPEECDDCGTLINTNESILILDDNGRYLCEDCFFERHCGENDE